MIENTCNNLGLESSKLDKLDGIVKNAPTISDFSFKIFKNFNGSNFISSISKALPWANKITELAGDAAPPIKFLIHLLKLIKSKNDPIKLGFIACTTAYQISVEQVARVLGELDPSAARMKTSIKKQLTSSPDAVIMKTYIFKEFSFENSLGHPFIKHADEIFCSYLSKADFPAKYIRNMINGIHVRFNENLISILCHRDTKDLFAPFKDFMSLNSKAYIHHEALKKHRDLQWWIFNEKPIFSQDTFSLSQIYVDIEAGKLFYKEIADSTKNKLFDKKDNENELIDPFSEKYGGRYVLSDAVLNLIKDPHFNDFIVIQGSAGSGKSAFTLKLCSDLINEGLRPIRILMRDVNLDKSLPIHEALGKAIRYDDELKGISSESYVKPDDPFNKNSIFNESVEFGTTICPYILILDGLDELSISASEGYKVRLYRILEQARYEYLHQNRPVKVRIILTGRPSAEISECPFLFKDTPIFTLRPFNPEQLNLFFTNLNKSEDKINIKDLEFILNSYKKYFTNSNRLDKNECRKKTENESQSLEVLGLPLLSYLYFSLLSKSNKEIENFIKNPTSLFRSLIDLTCDKAGKYTKDFENVEVQYKFCGGALRELLRSTATAMTVIGKESISFEELLRRINCTYEELANRVQHSIDENDLSKLVIGYYFKGGHFERGCEFLHKSFREYLFAENILEILKDFGRNSFNKFKKIDQYWKDFEPSNECYHLSRKLGRVLGPQWLSEEVIHHLKELIKWEIERSFNGNATKSKEEYCRTSSLPKEMWYLVRDGLVYIWEWWAEGVHLRSQPDYNQRKDIIFKPAYVNELIEWALPLKIQNNNVFPFPIRTSTIDAHLGDGLFRLCSLIHFEIAKNDGWLDWGITENSKYVNPLRLWGDIPDVKNRPKAYQTSVKMQNREYKLFAPFGANPIYFQNFAARINSAGWRPQNAFPLGIEMNGIDLRGVTIVIPPTENNMKVTINWDFSNISEAKISGSDLSSHSLRSILAVKLFAYSVSLVKAELQGANLSGSDLRSSKLSYAVLCNATIDDAYLRKADMGDADLQYCTLKRSILDNTDLRGADLRNADLTDANMRNADLRDTDIKNAKISAQQLKYTSK